MKTMLHDIKRFLGATRIYTPKFNPPVRYKLKRKWDLIGRLDSVFCPNKRLDRYQLFVTERILEIPFVHRTLECMPGDHILEFGCVNSKLCIELASIGIMVTGVDLRFYPLSHPNFTFYQGDFYNHSFTEASFDAIIAVSSVEHIGLGAYGEEEMAINSDRQLVKIFYDLLRPGGQLIITVPYGAWRVTSSSRIYDDNALNALLRGYIIKCEEYYRRVDYSQWLPTSAIELSQLKWIPISYGAEGVALISAQRPE